MSGSLIRIRATAVDRFGNRSEDERFTYSEQRAKRIVAGFKGRRSRWYGRTVRVVVDELQFTAKPREDLSFRSEIDA